MPPSPISRAQGHEPAPRSAIHQTNSRSTYVDHKSFIPHQGVQVSTQPQLRGSLTTGRIVMLVVAAAAPLGVVIGNVPIGLILGNGAGLPVAFLIAASLIACSAAGYVAMSRAVPSAGGFAAFVTAGLGPRLGRGTAYAIAVAYFAGVLALATGFGYFSNLILAGLGIELPWFAWTVAAMTVVAVFGRRSVDSSAKLLLAFMIAEFAILVVLDIAILVKHGLPALPLDVFSPDHVFSGQLGPALMVGFTSFIGVESAIIYAKEAKEPERSIPRATFGAIAAIAAFYVLTTWLVIGSIGVDDVVASATESEGSFIFMLTAANAGNLTLTIMQIFFCTSLLACLLALHNATTRYVHTLAGEKALPRTLSAVHARHASPHRASDAVAGLTAIVLLVCAVMGAEPYIGLGTSLTGLFTVGVIGLQILVSIAAIVYFRRRRDPRIWTTLVAPMVGGVGIAVGVGFIIANYSTLTGTNSLVANSLPAVLGIALAAGVLWGVRSQPAAGETESYESEEIATR
jgi:amino acid transporter